MPSFRRHQLVGLSPTGWAAIQRYSCDIQAQTCLAFWAEKGLPLVVTRQHSGLSKDQIALGLPAPLQWERRRLAFEVPINSLLFFGEFPSATDICPLLPPATHSSWLALTDCLDAVGADVRVYGSYGWQCVTGLDYLHPCSDLDLRLLVPNIAAAHQVVTALFTASFTSPRLDGELMFPNGNAVAWREWHAWQSGRTDRILVKRLRGATLESGQLWLLEPILC